MKSTWKKYLLYSAYILIGFGILYGLFQLILAGYSVSWTGFGERTLSNGDIVEEKTLWDWMELLIIPLVLALGAFLLNRSERAVERQIADDRRKEDRILADERTKLERDLATDRQQEAALQTYFDRMSELLLREKLRTTEIQEVRDVARTRTISVMRWLDPKRNNLVIQFLREANLITEEYSILNSANLDAVQLDRANLRELNLQNISFKYASLQGTFMQNAMLQGTNFIGANLKVAQLIGADLRDALLVFADFQLANLVNANLEMAQLTNANFQNANLKDAKITPAQLASAKSLKGATMPDGTIHE